MVLKECDKVILELERLVAYYKDCYKVGLRCFWCLLKLLVFLLQVFDARLRDHSTAAQHKKHKEDKKLQYRRHDDVILVVPTSRARLHAFGLQAKTKASPACLFGLAHLQTR